MNITLKSNSKLEIEGYAYAYRKFNRVKAPKVVEKNSLLRRAVKYIRVKHERTA